MKKTLECVDGGYDEISSLNNHRTRRQARQDTRSEVAVILVGDVDSAAIGADIRPVYPAC